MNYLSGDNKLASPGSPLKNPSNSYPTPSIVGVQLRFGNVAAATAATAAVDDNIFAITLTTSSVYIQS